MQRFQLHFVSVIFILSMTFSVARAQTPASQSEAENVMTPRDRVIAFLTPLTPSPSVKEDIPDDTPADVIPTAPVSDTEKPIAQEATDPPFKKGLPFYVSAPDYLERRGNGKDAQLRLTYQVSSYNAKTGIPSGVRETTLLIGSNYAALKTQSQTRIFDFLFNRQLILDHSTTPPILTHISLFPVVLKKIETVRGATQNGTLSTIKLSPELSLDSVWMEAALGYSARPAPKSMIIKTNENGLKAYYDDMDIFQSLHAQTPFPSPQHRHSFLAFLHHSLSIHPAILNAYTNKNGQDDTPPKRLKILKFSPKLSDGVEEIWEFKDSETALVPFPLPATASSITEQPDVSPLAFVISKAAKGEAIGGFPDHKSVEQALKSMDADENPFHRWLLTYRLVEIEGGCPDAPSCEPLKSLENRYQDDEGFTSHVSAFDPKDQPTARIDAIKTLSAHIESVGDAADIPAIVLRRLAMLRTRIKPADAKKAGISGINPQILLETAIAKDPYDPASYRGLSQIFAARKSYVESWNLQDAMWHLPLTRRPIMAPTERAETGILQQAPAFFHPDP